MTKNRSLTVFLIFAFTIVLLPEKSLVAQQQPNEPTQEQLRQVYSDLYFFRRNVDFAQEIAMRESFLSWLYKGIVNEVSKRQKEDLNGTVRAISPPELSSFDDAKFTLPENIDEAPPHIKYIAWEKSQRAQFNYKYLKARVIKKGLIDSSTPEQRRRMFRNDLQSAILSYRNNNFPEAILRFDELITQYDYDDFADILFYRGESYFALNQFKLAERDYKSVLEGDVSDDLHRIALLRLMTVAGDKGDGADLTRYWQIFRDRFGAGNDRTYWDVVDIVARYMMISGNAEKALELFDYIPVESSKFLASQYLAAECALTNLDLDDAEARFTALTALKYQDIKTSSELRGKARLKLGYISFLRGDYDIAFTIFTQASGSDDIQEKANIASAWSMYRLGAYNQTIALCKEFIEKFPHSEFLYEANALVGFSREIFGDDSSAIDQYQDIMLAVDDRQEFREFSYEKKQITDLVLELKGLEKDIFEKGGNDLFPKYMELRRNVGTLNQKMRLVEGYQSSPELKEMIKEQAVLIKTIKNQKELENALLESQDRVLLSQLERLISELFDLTRQVNQGIRYELSQQSLIQREENQSFTRLTSDTLKKHYQREWFKVDKTLERVKSLQNLTTRDTDPQLLADLVGVELELSYMRNKLALAQSALYSYGREEVSSNLDEWSDFAYQRYTYGGLDFDNFYSQEVRLTNLDNYINQVNLILAERRKVPEKIEQLPEELVLQSKAGEEPYFAPPMPMWKGFSQSESPLTEPVPEEMPAVDTTATPESVQPEIQVEDQPAGESESTATPEPEENQEEPVKP